MIRSAQLAALVSAQGNVAVPDVPAPTPDQVAYAPPNADGSRKNCANCTLWCEADGLCVIHGDLQIDPDMVCTYHVFGQPQLFASAMNRPPAMPPELTGLARVPGGTSCDLCRFSSAQGCRAVADPATHRAPFRNEALGCCGRWDPPKPDQV